MWLIFSHMIITKSKLRKIIRESLQEMTPEEIKQKKHDLHTAAFSEYEDQAWRDKNDIDKDEDRTAWNEYVAFCEKYKQ